MTAVVSDPVVGQEKARRNMEFATLMKSRWSCRGFLSEEVPTDTLEHILDVAGRTASWCNVQPWHVYAMRGAVLSHFTDELKAHVIGHRTDRTPDLELPGNYEGRHLDRKESAGEALYASMGIAREDQESRIAAMMENYNFFGAPLALIVTVERSHGPYAIADCGAFVANLMNAALNAGMGVIAQGAIGVHAEKVRSLLGISDNEAVLCGVALGYADESHPVNRFRTDRAPLSEVFTDVTAIGTRQ